jgi:hypothetical protein
LQIVWFFERNGRFVRCETCEGANGRWELLVLDADGVQRVERFEDDAALAARQRELEREFRGSGWFGPYGRFS